MARPRMGRPPIEIKWEDFEKLCGLHCTLEEIASWFHCSADTIERSCKKHYQESFAEIYRKKKAFGTISLRRKMWSMATDGNVTLLIWLSKQHLGFSDKMEQKVDQVVSGDIQWKANWGSQIEPTDKDVSKKS